MEDGSSGAKSEQEAGVPTLPEGIYAQTVGNAVEAARFGVDTLLLVAGTRDVCRLVIEHVAKLAVDAERIENPYAGVWRWTKGSGKLVVAGSIDAGRSAYRKLHSGMTISEAANALEVVSARRE